MLARLNKNLKQTVSRIGLGCASLSGEGGGYGFGDFSEKQAEELVKSSWELGINVFDTAPIYGFGLSEERLGRYLPPEAFIITKGGVDWHPNKRVNMTNRPEIIEKMLQESLKRLNREFIDLYMIHWPDSQVDIRRPLEILKNYQDKGIIKFIGLCNTNLIDLGRAREIVHIDAIQSELNAFNANSFQMLNQDWKDYFTMAWGTFDKGILSGRVKKGRVFDKSDCRSWAPWWNKKEVEQKVLRADKLEIILKDYELSLSEFAIHYNVTFFGINCALVGLKNTQDLIEVISILQKNISTKTIEEVLERWNK